MQDILLIIFIIMMLVASIGHVVQLVRRERCLRSFRRDMARAGRRVMGSNKK